MDRSRAYQNWSPYQIPGRSFQPEHGDGNDVLGVLETEDVGVKNASLRQLLQDHGQVQSSIHSDRSNFTPPAASVCDSEPSPDLKPQRAWSHPRTHQNRPQVNQSDLEQCRQALRRTFQDCDKAEFRSVTCLITCILNCARWLSRREVLAATALFDSQTEGISESLKFVSVNQQPQEDHWLRKCNPIVIETREGNMTFRSGAMRTFLRSFAIPGIDASHRTLALICRNQTLLDRRFSRNVTSTTDRSGIFQAVQVFSPYVTAFGDHHQRAASLTSMITFTDEDRSLAEAKNNGSEPNDDFEIIRNGTKQLSLSEENDNWVLLTRKSTTDRPSRT